MLNPLLSICIATYNRADYIGETLECIISQLTNDVEVVIVDGASTDNTQNIVNSYAKNCTQINYIRLDSKGGVDQDFCKAVEFAKGEYCWLFPDDDLLSANAVKTVLRELSKGYSLIVVNAKVMNMNFSKTLKNKRMPINKNEVYLKSEMDQLFNRAIAYLSFIGAVVINRDLWSSREKKKYFGTEFIHVGIIFQAPLPSSTLLIAEPYIKIRFGNAQWSSRAMDIWLIKWPELLYSFTHISENLRQKYQVNTIWTKFKKVVLLRNMGAYTLKEYQKWFSSKNNSIALKVVTLSVAILPKKMVNVFIYGYDKLVK